MAMPGAADAVRVVGALEASIYENPETRGDVGAHLAEDFVEVTRDGTPLNRDAVLERVAANPMVVESYPISDTDVRAYGEVVISTGRADLNGRIVNADGSETQISRSDRYVHVWVWRDEQWQVVYAQNSPLADS